MKKLINGDNRNSAYPVIAPWAIDATKNMEANHWSAKEVNLSDDIMDIKSGKISQQQLKQIKYVLAFFLNSESIISRGVTDILRRHTTCVEFANALSMQSLQELLIHHPTYDKMLGICASDEEREYITKLANECPEILAKNNFADVYVKHMDNNTFNLNTLENKQDYALALIIFGLVMEGIFFYPGFAQLLCMKNWNILKRCNENVVYIARDEAVHVNLAINAFNHLIAENPEIITNLFKYRVSELIKRAIDIEDKYIDLSVSLDILGFNPELAKSFTREIANRRLVSIGFEAIFEVKIPNALPWLSTVLDINKETNFFEGKVTDYQINQLDWD
jgi:ribonucleoside-diphosphate reductase beta chain